MSEQWQNKAPAPETREPGKNGYVLNVDGRQVFTADWVFEMMQAQSRRIDRARSIALAALALCAASVFGLLILAARCS